MEPTVSWQYSGPVSYTHLEMPYFFWRPNSGIERCIEGWARNGGTHHEVINIGSVAKRWKMLAGYLGVECVAI